MAHVGALRAWRGRPPVGVKVVIEGMEEVGGGAMTTYPPKQPAMFDADIMIIGDMGNVRPGVPTLTVALRGMANVIVEARTLASAKHSGLYGGAAPDALLALIQALATLHDEHGDVAVAELRREEWTGAGDTEEEFRALAEVADGQPLIGTGNLGSRVWSGPGIAVTGIDAPSVDDAVNAVSPYARAKLNLRVHPEQDAGQAQAALMRHLQSQLPFGVRIEVHAGATGNGFAARTKSQSQAMAGLKNKLDHDVRAPLPKRLVAGRIPRDPGGRKRVGRLSHYCGSVFRLAQLAAAPGKHAERWCHKNGHCGELCSKHQIQGVLDAHSCIIRPAMTSA